LFFSDFVFFIGGRLRDLGPIFTTGAGISLLLPCDWRFLPKLGPLRPEARGPLFVNGSATVCHVDSNKSFLISVIFFRVTMLWRSILRAR
jgi:hypothetical protein